MRPRLLAMCLLTASLLSLARSAVDPAAADVCDNPVVDILTFGIPFVCSPLDETGVVASGRNSCSIGGDIQAGASATGREYRFDVYCPIGEGLVLTADVTAVYDTRAHHATEQDKQVLESDAVVKTGYDCDSDPYIGEGTLANVHPTCTRTYVSVQGTANLGNGSAFDGGYISDDPIDLPLSVAVISDHARHVLNAQLQLVLTRPAPTATPSAVGQIIRAGTTAPGTSLSSVA